MDVVRGTTVSRNAVLAIVQALVFGCVLFLLYRYLLRTIGAEQIGIWAIVMATASLSRIGEMGFAGSSVKFTAKYIARGENTRAANVVETTVVTIGVVLAGVLAASYPVIVWLMEVIVPADQVTAALSILSLALVAVWVGAIAGIPLSGLDGCQRVDLRAWVAMLASLFFLALTWVLVPGYGLVGLVWAQIAQAAVSAIASWILLRRELSGLPWLPRHWHRSLFREMFRYGVHFQTASIAALLFEPTTKALLVKFGGLTLTAYFEMANRMVLQFRALLVSANQVVVPSVSALHEISPKRIRKVYLDSYRVLFFLALPLSALVAASAPLVSEIWIGRYEHSFVVYSLFLCVGFWLNTLVGPAYFVNLGTGQLRWNTAGHVAMGVLNGLLGFLLGSTFGAEGVVAGYGLALALGSSLIVLGYHRDNGISLSELLPAESKALLLVSWFGPLAGLAVFNFLTIPEESLPKAGLSLAVCALVIAPAFWKHPLRPRLARKFTATLWKSASRRPLP